MGKRLIIHCTVIVCLCLMMFQLQGCSTDSSSDSSSEVEFYVFTEGMGTEANPFHVTTVDQLQAIDDTLFLDKHFIQASDIDASASSEFQLGSGFKHIGDVDTPFTGSYDGNGYVIHSLRIHYQRSQGTHTGLFGYIKNGRIENITVDNSAHIENIQSNLQSAYNKVDQQSDNYISNNVDLSNELGIGGLVGFNDGGDIINCTFIGWVGGHIHFASSGLVGINTGLIENSHFRGKTLGGSAIGFSSINTGKIIDSSAEFQGNGINTYGFVRINYGEIIRSYAHVDLRASTLSSAGFGLSNISGRIESSYVTGKVSGSRVTTGFIINNSGEVINSYSNVNLSISKDPDVDTYTASLFVYENTEGGVIEHSYATGTITATEEGAEIGAVAVKNEGILESVYWDMDTIGNEDAVLFGSTEGTVGLSSEQMTSTAARDNMPTFDWNAVWKTTASYPVLRWEE